jgi:hypothetical protein
MVRRAPDPARTVIRVGTALAVVLSALSLGAGSAAGDTLGCFGPVPPRGGIPPWGFHTGPPLSGAAGSYARAWGDINLGTNWISGKICQENRVPPNQDRMIVMTPEPYIVYHTHTGTMWGYPGNLIKVNIKVVSSTDALCKVGTVGHMTMFGSYNGVRSDSIQFSFPAACSDHNHLYHGPQVNAQVPPL